MLVKERDHIRDSGIWTSATQPVETEITPQFRKGVRETLQQQKIIPTTHWAIKRIKWMYEKINDIQNKIEESKDAMLVAKEQLDGVLREEEIAKNTLSSIVNINDLFRDRIDFIT